MGQLSHQTMSELHPSCRKLSLEWMPRTETPETDETQVGNRTPHTQSRGGWYQGGHLSVREVTGTAVFEMREITAGKNILKLFTLVAYGRN